MTQTLALAPAYDRIAPYYDAFTAGYAYDAWIAAIEQRARALGLRGRRALDLACGTGNSTAPLLQRGYSVLACDISPAMVTRARLKFPQHADSFFVADMRDLPRLGEFDLILCLDDAINYLLSVEELEATFAGVARALARDGVFAFDVNTLLTYRTSFAEASIRDASSVLMAWRGEATPSFQRGEIGSATVEIFNRRDDGLWERSSMQHVQRHHPPEVIGDALVHAGFDYTVAGQHPGARLEDEYDDDLNIKIVYLATHSRARAEEGR